jgi:hypothetical protein
MAGAVVINRRDGSKIDLANVQSGILVPSMEEVLSVDLSRVRWVLVIEKEVRCFYGRTIDKGLTLSRLHTNPSHHLKTGKR